MPWCPNCKTEYKEGVTHCSDCHAELVADYNEVLKLDATELLVAVDARNTGFAQRLCDSWSIPESSAHWMIRKKNPSVFWFARRI